MRVMSVFRGCCQAVRRGVRNSASSSPSPIISPVPPSSTPIFIRPRRDLLKAAGFTLGISGGVYVAAVVVDYEQSRYRMRHLFDWKLTKPTWWDDVGTSTAGASEEWNWRRRWKALSACQKATFAIIALNCGVFLLWRVAALGPFMRQYFVDSYHQGSRWSAMLLSVFSHSNLIHLALNMTVLYQFAGVSAECFLGREQYIAFFLAAGVFSSLGSLTHKALMRSPAAALGASGAIFALLMYTCMRLPDQRLQIIFLPFFDFSGEQAVIGLLAIDVLGLLLRWRWFDHAAHLGGSLFGIWYAMYGQSLLWDRWRLPVAKVYQKLRYGDAPKA